MGLFSNWGKKSTGTSREIEFNRKKVQKELIDLGKVLYEVRNDETSRLFCAYIQKMMNLEILQLSEQRELTSESYAFTRGRIEALKGVLITREKFIDDRKRAKETKVKESKSDHESKRSYIRPQTTPAGLSI